jgi:hypothetical protein
MRCRMYIPGSYWKRINITKVNPWRDSQLGDNVETQKMSHANLYKVIPDDDVSTLHSEGEWWLVVEGKEEKERLGGICATRLMTSTDSISDRNDL